MAATKVGGRRRALALGRKPMTTLFARHTVSNYDEWRKVYDGSAPVQKMWGVSDEAVYRGTDDPNDITVMHEFPTIEAAVAFAHSEDLKKAMQSAGVVGEPTIWFADKT
jgi:hypothetical protein